ncbi:hypothetical protein SAMN02800692_1994 [Luteibacter sp. UNC138MFCol5.1]|uniref:hypothetical protein n=1 Tax=Luteibacter sp. UNC138MFCol5.1 TaxID=1502774 RepID=UPI0008C8B4AA|nr:hypothetical protein [Luteibacter sp. UNC138MFCol5.1]SEO76371.1 hypothetical protein SAMN02800692_1994 [Luteibacter sp. UNC138MFCol5.1]
MLDVSEIFADPEFAQAVSVQRGQGAYLADGTWSQGYLAGTLTAIVHPVKPDDLQLLPEGERHLPCKKVMSQDPVAIGDLIEYQGHTWRLSQLSDWSEYGYYNGIAVRHEGTAQPGAPSFGVT